MSTLGPKLYRWPFTKFDRLRFCVRTHNNQMEKPIRCRELKEIIRFHFLFLLQMIPCEKWVEGSQIIISETLLWWLQVSPRFLVEPLFSGPKNMLQNWQFWEEFWKNENIQSDSFQWQTRFRGSKLNQVNQKIM